MPRVRMLADYHARDARAAKGAEVYLNPLRAAKLVAQGLAEYVKARPVVDAGDVAPAAEPTAKKPKPTKDKP